MKSDIVEVLKRELAARGFSGGTSPNGTMTLDDEYLNAMGLGQLLEQLVARREKTFHSGGVVGADVARQGYDDAARAVEAVRAVIEGLVLPAETKAGD